MLEEEKLESDEEVAAAPPKGQGQEDTGRAQSPAPAQSWFETRINI
jgi:hypothetical protein